MWLGLSSCNETPPPSPTLSANVITTWNDVVLQIQRYAPGYAPPIASRMLGYVNLAAYEAAAPQFKQYHSVAHRFPALKLPTKPTGALDNEVVVNQVYFNLLSKFYPHIQASDKSKIQETYAQLDGTSLASNEVKTRSKAWADAVANAVWAWAETDELGQKAYLNPRPADYVAPLGRGFWPRGIAPLTPYWGNVRSFAISQVDKESSPPFLSYSETPTSEYYRQAKENYDEVNKHNATNQWIGEFWSDDFSGLTFDPSSRFLAIANPLYIKEKFSLEKALYTNTRISMAMADAAILIWYSKFKYNVERPAHYINRIIDAKWTTALENNVTGQKNVNPPFPAYPSGHAGFAGAAAQILSLDFGEQYAFTDACHQGRTEFNGTPRSFVGFRQMAEENALSRIYLGIHFRTDAEEGLRLGYLAGKRVDELFR